MPGYLAAQVAGAIARRLPHRRRAGQQASDVGLGVASYADTVPATQAFLAEFVGTFLLVFTVFGVIYRKAAAGWAGLAIGLVVFAAIIPVAPTTGASINPARTVGPMLVQQIAGGDVSWAQLPGVRRRRAARRRRWRPSRSALIAHTPAGPRARPRPPSAERRPRPNAGGPSMKKLINAPADVAGRGPARHRGRHPDLRVDHEHQVIYRGEAQRPGKVGLVSGGGSGHEPLHGGFVGTGHARRRVRRRGVHLAGARPDASRRPRCVDGGAGVLHIVKNYTGDVMNFEMAGRAGGRRAGRRVATVVTDDDVAVQDSMWTAGRRGVGVTVLLEKIVGAAAEEGRDLDAVADARRAVNDARSRRWAWR